MSRDFPALVDVWALVRGRQGFSGSWPLSRMERLVDLLHSSEGEAWFEVQFDVDEATGTPLADLVVRAELPLLCQRDLEPYAHRIERRTRLGLIRHEDEEAALPEGTEPYLVPEQPVSLADMVEDELILAVPLVPMRSSGALGVVDDDEPGDPGPYGPFEAAPDEAMRRPFAELASLLKGGDEKQD